MTFSIFVTGTDTDVGKTLVSCALLLLLRNQFERVVGMKPVAAGGTDAVALRAASSVQVPPDLDNPYPLAQPVSPHLAAQAEGVHIDVATLTQRYRQLVGLADAVVVEGAGGFHVPLNQTQTGADLAVALNLPVLLVVGLRLGCLNHALLTQEAVLARGLPLAGWVANRLDPHMQAQDDNIATLRARLQAPLWADIAYLGQAPEAQRPKRVKWQPAVREWGFQV
jgi:dethiobiotin synthetase